MQLFFFFSFWNMYGMSWNFGTYWSGPAGTTPVVRAMNKLVFGLDLIQGLHGLDKNSVTCLGVGVFFILFLTYHAFSIFQIGLFHLNFIHPMWKTWS